MLGDGSAVSKAHWSMLKNYVGDYISDFMARI